VGLGVGEGVNLLEIYFCNLDSFVTVFGEVEKGDDRAENKKDLEGCVREKKEADKRRKGMIEMKKVRNNGAGKERWKGGNGIELFKE